MSVSKASGTGIVVAAAVFGAALLGTSALASRSLRQRDAAVRDGILARAAHELEAQLRASTPSEAGPVLETFLADRRDVVAGVSVIGPAGVVARAGAEPDGSFEVTAGLGRDWRLSVMGPGSEEGRGGGPGGGYMGGRGAGGRGGPQMRVRLQPAPALGRDSSLARFVLAGGFASALALVALAVVAARGLAEKGRREAAEADAWRLATVARAGAGLAHRLRNPLAVVKGTAQLLEERVPEAERERAARIVAASGRMETILSRLLDFARPPAPQPTPFDLAALAREVASRAEGVAVLADAPVAVHADREHVETILEELLANARAFDPDGTIEVAASLREAKARLEVLDRGPGPELDPASAFEPYATSRPDGTGLGLAIVRALAVANGGSASLGARPGGGCAATLVLPGKGA